MLTRLFANGDTLPDALTFDRPPLVSQPLITVTTHSAALDIAFADLATPPGSWYDGIFLTVTLRVNEMNGSTPMSTTVTFAQSIPPSLGSAVGTSIPAHAVDGVVQLIPAAVPARQYLPLIAQD